MEPERQPEALPGPKLQQNGPSPGSRGLPTHLGALPQPHSGTYVQKLAFPVYQVLTKLLLEWLTVLRPSEYSVWFCWYHHFPYPFLVFCLFVAVICFAFWFGFCLF